MYRGTTASPITAVQTELTSPASKFLPIGCTDIRDGCRLKTDLHGSQPQLPESVVCRAAIGSHILAATTVFSVFFTA
jgi:hypothetical protein